jgi:hypothetical protein
VIATIAATIATLALLALGGALAWRAGGPAGRPAEWATPVRLLVLGYLLLNGVGAVALAAVGESTGGAVLIGAGLAAVGVGAAASRRVLGPVAPIEPTQVVGPIRPVAVIGLALVGLAAYAALAVANGVPLLSPNAQAVRTGFSGIRLDVFRWLVPAAALVALAVALAVRRREAWLVAAVALGVTAALEILSASRALPFELGLTAIIVAWWAGRRFRLGTWALLAAAAAAIFLGVLFARVAPEGGFSGPLDAVGFAVNRTVGRIVLIQPRTVDLVVEAFPDPEPYLLGTTYIRWTAGLRGEATPQSLGAWLFGRLFPGEPPGGFAAPGLLAEGYANFGPAFALLLMLALGVATEWLGRIVAVAPPDAATRVACALLAVAALRTYATSLNGFLLTIAVTAAWWVAARPGAFGLVRAVVGRRAGRAPA